MRILCLLLVLTSSRAFAQAAQQESPPPVTMEMKGAELTEFLNIMGSLAKVNVILHPQVQGKVTFNVRDADWNALLDMILRNHGLGREMAANIMRIVPLTVMESESRQIAAVQAARLAAAPLETRIHVLSYVKAADVAPIFSQLLSPRGRLMVDPRLNMIIIKDVAP